MSAQPIDAPDYAALKRRLYEVRARHAALTRHRGADDPEVIRVGAEVADLHARIAEPKRNMARDAAADRLAAFAMRIAEDAPPLTPEQINRISSILAGTR